MGELQKSWTCVAAWPAARPSAARAYAIALYEDASATLDDLREAVTTLEGTERIARRVLGGAHPTTTGIFVTLLNARAALAARESPPPPNA